MIALWLFLYLAWLVQNLGLLTVEGRSWSTFFLVLPLLVLPLAARLRARRPEFFHGWSTRVAGLVAAASALFLARLLSLDFWDTKRTGASLLVALLGLGLQWVMLARPEKTGGLGLWLWIAFWEYAGAWHPALTPLGAGLGAALVAFDVLPKQTVSRGPQRSLGIWPVFLLLGLTLPKPAWDFLLEPTWAEAFAAFAVGMGLAQTTPLRSLGDRLPSFLLAGFLALLFVFYPTAYTWAWALVLGVIAGWNWLRLSRPLPMVQVSAAFLLGLLLSFLLHANAGRPVLKHFVWPRGGAATY